MYLFFFFYYTYSDPFFQNKRKHIFTEQIHVHRVLSGSVRVLRSTENLSVRLPVLFLFKLLPRLWHDLPQKEWVHQHFNDQKQHKITTIHLKTHVSPVFCLLSSSVACQARGDTFATEDDLIITTTPPTTTAAPAAAEALSSLTANITDAPVDPDAAPCSGRPFDAFLQLKNGSIYAFRGWSGAVTPNIYPKKRTLSIVKKVLRHI